MNNVNIGTPAPSILLGQSNTWTGAQIMEASLLIGDTANAKSTLGLTINQGAADNELFAGKSSDVAHPFTTQTEADTYVIIRKYEAAAGGFSLQGFKSSAGGNYGAISLFGNLGEAADTTKSSAGGAIIMLGAYITDGSTSRIAPGANQNVLGIYAGNTGVWIVDAEGDVWQYGNITAEGGTAILGRGEGLKVAATDATIRPPNLVSGVTDPVTPNVAGADFYIKGALGRGTGDVGQIIFQTAQVAAADTVQTYETILTLDEDEAIFAKAISIGANLLKTTNLVFKELDAGSFAIRNAADNAYLSLRLSNLYFTESLTAGASNLAINPPNVDDSYMLFKGRDNTVGLVEVASIRGAADPYFGLGVSGAVLKATNAGLLGFFAATPVAQQAHVADPAAAAAVTFTHAWNGATYPAAAEGAALIADLGALKTAIDANNTAIDSILAQLATLGLQAAA
uniref:Uncharacterized protein n=1 Tax=viral metagenome TaxID=1070528 RepID=A0A6H1ZHE7_9ZZZZ